MSTLATLYREHKPILESALEACARRSFFSPFVESPSAKLHGADRVAQGRTWFDGQLGKPFDLEQPGTIGRVGREVSPYTQAPLDIDYPKADVDTLFEAARKAMPPWNKLSPNEKAGICLEMAVRLDSQNFENAHATMHTAGQSYLMAFSGSGANALDRGIEALTYAYRAVTDIPAEATWEKRFGGAGVVTLKKEYRLVPRGVAVVICCATFPLWNAYPAIFANLMTGNPVILKPHPNGILPVALAVRKCRAVLTNLGLDPNVILMAADTRAAPVTMALLQHKDTAIVDYTGSQRFGTWIEQNCHDKLVYTETAGCNGVVIHSMADVDDMVRGLANGLCGFSAQMCTSPQNIHIPAGGIDTNDGHLSFEEIRDRIVAAVRDNVATPKKAAAFCATVQADETLQLLSEIRKKGADQGSVILESASYEHPDFPGARTATPLIIELEGANADLCREEHFGPVSFIIRESSAEAALASATRNARECGAISSYAYSSDPEFLAHAQNEFADAGASLWCNMTGRMPINFAAAYSDFHVTGMNPAGNACLADLAFVTNRFRIIQFREPVRP